MTSTKGKGVLLPQNQTEQRLRNTVRPRLRRVVVIGLVAVVMLGIASLDPVSAQVVNAQVVNEGNRQESLECAPVFVDGVDPADSLNVRLGPGVAFDIVQTLDPGAPAVATGLVEEVGVSIWYQIGVASCDAVGWVNSRFLELGENGSEAVPTTESPSTTQSPGTTQASAAEENPATSISDGTDRSAGNPTEGIQLSPLALGLLGLGLLGLAVGVFMAIRGRRSSADGGPPAGMVGPPGGPYYLAKLDKRDEEPQTIQVGGDSVPIPGRRETDHLLFEPIDEPLSAFPSVPDLATEIEKEADKMARPAKRLFGTNSLAAGNATEGENGS